MKGIVNIGNTCYYNSLLQCLVNCYPLRRYMQMYKSDEVFNEFINDYWELHDPIINPRDLVIQLLKHTPNFERMVQQDAHESYLYILEYLHKAYKDRQYTKRYNLNHDNWEPSVISDIFTGQMKITVDDTHYENFNSIELSPTCDVTVDALLFDFFQPERVPDTDIIIHRKLEYLPQCLVLTFKQYITKFKISYKENLNVEWFVAQKQEQTKYDLYGIILHSGNHYISMNKNIDGKWFMCNDRQVTKHELHNICKHNVYMLFYTVVS